MKKIIKVQILRLKSGSGKQIDDFVANEHPLTVTVNGEVVATLLCLPSDLKHLALGFLLSEGLIENEERIGEIVLSAQNSFVNVTLERDFAIPDDFFQKRIIGSGCGRGLHFYDPRDREGCLPIQSEITIAESEVYRLMKEFGKQSEIYNKTGGVHSAALCFKDRIEYFKEDIGRHNAVDKIFGECFLKRIPVDNTILFTSGRISSEILIKTVKRGVPIIISPSAPMNLAVDIAESMNVTIVGFVRGKRMNIYTHPGRIT